MTHVFKDYKLESNEKCFDCKWDFATYILFFVLTKIHASEGEMEGAVKNPKGEKGEVLDWFFVVIFWGLFGFLD